MKISGKLKNIDKLEAGLGVIASRGQEFAQVKTLNKLSFKGMEEARDEAEKVFVMRNKWSRGSIIFSRASLSSMKSTVGSTEKYMATQELGGTTRPNSGAKSVSIPTGYASGEEGQRTKRRLPRDQNKIKNMRLRKAKGRSRKEKNAVAIREAKTGKNKHVYLHTSKTKGIFKVLGGKRTTKIKMVHDLSRKSVPIKRERWLMPAVTRTAKKGQSIYNREIKRQVIRAFRM